MSDAGETDPEAAELALGLLEGEERRAAERRALSEPAFARAVEDWQNRFSALAGGLTPVAPPPRLWSEIATRLDRGGQVLRWRHQARLWRAGAGAASALAAGLALTLVLQRPHSERLLTAELSGGQGPTAFVAIVDPASHQVVLAPARITAVPGRTPELWLVPSGGKPVALGLGAFERTVKLPLNAPLRGALLAVSLEPPGGSPTGQPTGPVVASGSPRTM